MRFVIVTWWLEWQGRDESRNAKSLGSLPRQICGLRNGMDAQTAGRIEASICVFCSVEELFAVSARECYDVADNRLKGLQLETCALQRS
jgi:hypothetical protein